jgi:hypothetical protein
MPTHFRTDGVDHPLADGQAQINLVGRPPCTVTAGELLDVIGDGVEASTEVVSDLVEIRGHQHPSMMVRYRRKARVNR